MVRNFIFLQNPKIIKVEMAVFSATKAQVSTLQRILHGKNNPPITSRGKLNLGMFYLYKNTRGAFLDTLCVTKDVL